MTRIKTLYGGHTKWIEVSKKAKKTFSARATEAFLESQGIAFKDFYAFGAIVNSHIMRKTIDQQQRRSPQQRNRGPSAPFSASDPRRTQDPRTSHASSSRPQSAWESPPQYFPDEDQKSNVGSADGPTVRMEQAIRESHATLEGDEERRRQQRDEPSPASKPNEEMD